LIEKQAGRPDGADFGPDARRMLETQLRGGMSIADLEKALKSPQPQQPQARCSAVSVKLRGTHSSSHVTTASCQCFRAFSLPRPFLHATSINP